jgi:hypothetical protein
VYEWLNLPTTGVLHEADAFAAIKAYMTMYTSGGNSSVCTKTDLLQKRGGLNHRTKQWLREVQAKVAEAESMCDDSTGDCGRLDFNAATRVVEEIGEQYRSFNEHECDDLTNTLEQSADMPGKVRLTDFYAEGLHGSWNFTETPEYLRALGALEEGDLEPRVLIPNYVASRPNCLATSSVYVVCCRNQCESMMSQLELAIAAPVGEPRQILDVLRVTSEEAAEQLAIFANQRGGKVPLHGHAFAQWLHEVFPRFCPRPHAAGVSHVQTDEERALETGATVTTQEVTFVDSAEDVMLFEESRVTSAVPKQVTPPHVPTLNHRFCAITGLLICSAIVAMWASQGVLFDADGVLCLNQFTSSKKNPRNQKSVQMPMFRVILLSLSLVAIVFVLDVLMCELWTASAGDLVLGAVMMAGSFMAACIVKKNMMTLQSSKQSETPVVSLA